MKNTIIKELPISEIDYSTDWAVGLVQKEVGVGMGVRILERGVRETKDPDTVVVTVKYEI
jgi:hypothetical protein